MVDRQGNKAILTLFVYYGIFSQTLFYYKVHFDPHIAMSLEDLAPSLIDSYS